MGLFAAFIIPIGQFVLAALLAVPTRANVPLAAAATLVTNPLTFPPIYYAAYKVGSALLDRVSSRDADELATHLGSTVLDVSGPTAFGLLVFAIVSAGLAFLVGSFWWRLRLSRRWRWRRTGE